jgi:hypothetical protein
MSDKTPLTDERLKFLMARAEDSAHGQTVVGADELHSMAAELVRFRTTIGAVKSHLAWNRVGTAL